MDKKELINSLKKQGFSEEIIKAFSNVKREDFIPEEFKDSAYEDEPLPIGYGQTISQPYTIAFMLKLLELGDNQKILEVGSGSGYVLALMNEISKNSEIYAIERIKGLTEISKKVLKDKRNIKIIYGDGSKGIIGEQFDRILVSAGSEDIPQRLLHQLKYKGILVCVVKNSIIAVKKEVGGNKIYEYPGFVFVPLIED